MTSAAALTTELEAALLREVAATWNSINYNHFRGQLKTPVFGLHDGGGRLGFWEHRTRRLSLLRTAVLQQPWVVICELLKHETAHQFVDEVMGVREETAHGPSFEQVCRQLGFDASASGMPAVAATAGGGVPSESSAQAVLRRIGKLLALAESPNLHEAELAMQEAHRLMLKHNIDVVTTGAAQGYSFRQLGIPRRRIDAHEQILAGLLGHHFFVEAIWVPSYLPLEGRSGRVLEVCGTPGNLDVAAYVHGFLLETGERLWREHKRQHGIAGDRERRRFLLGVMTGFRDKLARGAVDNRREGLVWRGDPALSRYYEQRHPRRSSGGTVTFQRTSAYEHGVAAGRQVVLHRPVTANPQSSRGRLLTGR